MRRLLFSWLLVFGVVGHALAEEFLDPELAFRSSVRAVDARTLEVRVEIADGYYLYRDRFRFAVDAQAGTLGAPVFPPGKTKTDDYFGTTTVYVHEVVVTLPLVRSGPATTARLDLTLQGCATAGFCYPPQKRVLQAELPPAPASGAGGAEASAAVAGPAPATAGAEAAVAAPADEASTIVSTLRDAGLVASLAFFFVAGLGLSLTPCVFPMIPILSGIIVGQGGTVTRRRGFGLSVAYVLGMALTYAAAGVAAGMTGTLISNSLQNPWVLGGFAMVFVLLSLSMFGFYELQMPAAIQSRLSSGAGRLQGGQGLGVFLMGALSALIVGPCVAAPLAGALLYIGQTGDAVLGGLALFMMALGMGVPLLLVGLSAGALLPRSGAWMEQVKQVFGVLLLALAVQLVSPVVPVAATMLAWSLLLIVPAIFLRALDPLPPGASGWSRLWKGCGIVMLITGAALLVGVLAGNRDPLQPLLGVNFPAQANAAEAASPVRFERVASVAELDARLQASTQPVMLDFYADWCVACKEMEHLTFGDPAVQARLAGFTLLQADVTRNDADDKALLKRFGLFGPPGIIFFPGKGSADVAQRVVGFQDAPRFLSSLAAIGSG